MSTSVQQHREAVVDGGFRPDRGGLLSRCEESWSRIQCRRPSQAARLIQPTDRIRPLAVLAWGLALLALLPHLLCEALASGFVGGPDFPINNYTTGAQIDPSVSGLTGGGFVVTWAGGRPGGDLFDISGRLFGASGTALGSDFPINYNFIQNQQSPSVSGLSGGGFVVTWQGARRFNGLFDIYGRIFDASGVAAGSDFPINTYTTGDQFFPSVSALSGGGFVVAWHGPRPGIAGRCISGRIFDPSGVAAGPEFPINNYTVGNQEHPGLSALSGGGFVVTWSGPRQGGSGDDISGRLYDVSGRAVGLEFPINTYTTGDQLNPSVSGLSGGGFVVTWYGPRQSGSGDDISGRLYDAVGRAVGADFPINTYTTGDQLNPSVAALSGGGFVVTWSGPGISSRIFDASRVALGLDFPINTYTRGSRRDSCVLGLSGGGFVVAWWGDVQGGDSFDISGRLFTLNGTTAASTTTEVMGGTTSGRGVTAVTTGTRSTLVGVAGGTTSGRGVTAVTTGTRSTLVGVAGGTTAGMAVSPQPITDSPGPALAAGVGAGAAAFVCSLLSGLGLVLLRRRRVAERAAVEEANPPSTDVAMNTRPAYDRLPVGAGSVDHGESTMSVRSVPNTDYRVAPVNSGALYGQLAEKTDGSSSSGGAAYGHVLQNGGAMYGQLAEKTGDHSPPARVVYTGLREKTDGSSS